VREPDANQSDPLEDLLMQALERLETDGVDGVEELLRDHPAEASRVRRALKDLDTADLLEQPPSQLPEHFGEFSILDQLGAGGMGVVFLARQDSLGREVALKVIRPELLLFEGSRERFQREIDAVARLEHPAIVQILATGIEDGVPYYAMPRLRGRNGEAVIAALASRDPTTLSGEDLRLALGDADSESISDIDGTFTGAYWQAIVRLVRKAALGIHHAHARGVLHRDIKPSNLVFTPTGHAIVLDFGLAQAHGDVRLTQTGAAAGSPAYMAPEQVRGEPADERSDIYSLAATLHCLLGLRPPYPIDNSEVLRARILAGERHDLKRRVALPPELLVVLDCAMDIDRVRRYQSARAFADDLQAVLDGRPIHARTLPLPVRVRRFAQSHRAFSAALAVAAVFLVLLPTALLWQEKRASQRLSDQVTKTQTANAALEKVNTELEAAQAQLQDANRALRKTNEELSQQVDRSDRSVRISLEAVEQLLANLGRDKLRLVPGTMLIAQSVLQEAVELFDKLADEERFRIEVMFGRFNALHHLVSLQDTLGHYDDAERTAKVALQLLEDALPQDAPAPGGYRIVRGNLYRALAALRIKQQRPEQAQRFVDAARKDYESARELPSSERAAIEGLGMTESLQAALHTDGGDAQAAEASLRRAVDFTGRTSTPGVAPVPHLAARLNLSKLLRLTRRNREAFEIATAVLRELQAAPQKDTGWPTTDMLEAMARAERFRNLQIMGRAQLAADEYPAIMAKLDALLNDYPHASDARTLRAGTLGNMARSLLPGDLERALPLVDRAIDELHLVLESSPNDADAIDFLTQQLKNSAYIRRRTGDWPKLQATALELGTMPGGGTHRETAARDLIRCAQHVDGELRDKLHDKAMEYLLASFRSGARVLVDDPLYAPLHDDARFAELRQ